MSSIDWKNFEDLLFTAALEAANQLMNRNNGAFYAVVFHEFSSDVMALPCLVANSEEYLAQDDSSRWSSADWEWISIKYSTPELRKLHRVIQKAAAKGGDDDLWQLT